MLPGHTPFVGRERQLGELAAAMDAAELGEHVLALIAGEPGIGKTRLVNEVASRVTSRVLRSACWPDDAPAYWPWRQLLGALRGTGPSLSPEPEGEHPEPNLGSEGRFQLFDRVAEERCGSHCCWFSTTCTGRMRPRSACSST
jgi:AAA ATPase domain